jgi:hypothetical protein
MNNNNCGESHDGNKYRQVEFAEFKGTVSRDFHPIFFTN